jgi:hypothetical protein
MTTAFARDNTAADTSIDPLGRMTLATMCRSSRVEIERGSDSEGNASITIVVDGASISFTENAQPSLGIESGRAAFIADIGHRFAATEDIVYELAYIAYDCVAET